MSLPKSSKPFSLKNLKLKICTKEKKNDDYEFVPYIQTNRPKNDQKISIHKQKGLKLHSNPEKRILAEPPQLQSTKIEQSRFDFSVLEQTPLNCPPNKLSSTRITQFSHSIFTIDPTFIQQTDVSIYNQECKTYYNQNYSTPLNYNKEKHFSISSSNDSSKSTNENESDYSFSNQVTTDVHSEHEQFYVCNVKSIDPKSQGDLNLKFGDRVRLIHKDRDYFLVQDIVRGQCGYVKHQFIIPLQTFLNQFL